MITQIRKRDGKIEDFHPRRSPELSIRRLKHAEDMIMPEQNTFASR